ncbi:MAG: D-galactarate dehydratase [Limimaricola soesokkakensis]|nr:D-galactarate dehydratase [Limimaricola soesokkakensis]MCZ4262918.1 D-galactarate dehydratase [Limimaricola sp. G21655-S1]
MTRLMIPTALAALGLLSACAEMQQASAPSAAPASEATAAAPQPAVQSAPPPPPEAASAAALDTTTPEQRAAATAAPEPAGEQRLGTTIASLGSPADPGLWIETPLVSSVTQGRVEAANGKSVKLELRPSGGAAGSGSEISLPAMRLLEVSLTSLPELTVYSG